MNIRIPQSGKAAKLAKAYLASQGFAVTHQQCLELIARLHGYQDLQSMQGDSSFAERPVLRALSSSEYEFAHPGAEAAWIGVDNISVYVRKNYEGVSVDLYPKASEMSESMAGTWLSFAEAQPDEDLSLQRVYLQVDEELGDWHWSVTELASTHLQASMPVPPPGVRGQDWDGRYTSPEAAIRALEHRFEAGFTLDWQAPCSQSVEPCTVLQDNTEYASGLDYKTALATAKGLCDAGAGGTWMVMSGDRLMAVHR